MKRVDPMSVTCLACGYEAAYRPAELVALSAECVSCGAPLDNLGLAMRHQQNDVGGGLGSLFVVMLLEKEYSPEFPELSDQQLDRVVNGEDLVELIRRESIHGEATDVIERQVIAAIKAVKKNDNDHQNDPLALPLQEFRVELACTNTATDRSQWLGEPFSEIFAVHAHPAQ